MNDKLFDKLFDLRKKENLLVDVIKQEEAKVIPFKENLIDLQEEITKVQGSIMAHMERENVKTYTYEDKNVTTAVRKSLVIADDAKVMASLLNDPDLKKITKLKMPELREKLTIVKLNHTNAKEFAKQLVDIGNQVDGVEVKETKYLTVKEI